MNLPVPDTPSRLPEIAEVTPTAAFRWLAKGIGDMQQNPVASLFYGVMFAAAGWALHAVFANVPQYTPTLAMGFLLVGPVLALGIYDLSRQIEAGKRPRLAPSLLAWRDNVGGIGIFVLMLTVVFLVWGRASLVTFALFESRGMPNWTAFMKQLETLQHADFLFAFFGIGFLFAALVFVFSAIAFPHLLAARSDAVTAAAVSVTAVTNNPIALMIWALLIVLLIGIGLATAYIALIFTAPLVGHATWHAYRELVPIKQV